MLNFRKANIWICRLIGTELVDLYVGPEKQHFRVHKKILGFFKANRVLPCPNFMVYIYSQTKKTSPIRKLVVRSLHWVVLSPGKSAEWPVAKLAKAQNECGDLSVDFMQLLRDRVEPQNPWALPNCEFHVHGKDQPCMSSRN
jgi:hypothetical protein